MYSCIVDDLKKYLSQKNNHDKIILSDYLENKLNELNISLIITENKYPYIVKYVNNLWCKSCEFNRNKIIGNTCKLLQGCGTCQLKKKEIRENIINEKPYTTIIVNYNQNKLPFLNLLFISPLKNNQNQKIKYFGLIKTRYIYQFFNFNFKKEIIRQNNKIIDFINDINKNEIDTEDEIISTKYPININNYHFLQQLKNGIAILNYNISKKKIESNNLKIINCIYDNFKYYK